MHTNPAFRAAATADNLAFAAARGFGVLSVNGPDGPLASHVPFLLAEDGHTAELHLTRANPIARAGLPLAAVLMISGPDAYISPDWYGIDDQVPTWNYIAVHLRGTLAPLPDEALELHLNALSAAHESRLLPKQPWVTAKMTEGVMPRMMRMILPFRLTITSVDGTWKLNQNKTTETRARAAGHLAVQADPGAQAIARLIRALPQE